MTLYPLKFRPKVLPKVWGSETWEISCCGDHISEIANGQLEGDSLQDILETYMSDLVGDKVYDIYGNRFPLLMKFIDAKDDLSVQVHPDDMTAFDRNRELGKTEMWYVVDAEEGGELTVGFSLETDMDELQKALEQHKVLDLLQRVPVKKGDVVFLPAGTVHALNRGVKVAEIQESSDITYRIYDYDRLGLDGQPRQLHIDEAMEVIDYTACEEPKVEYEVPTLGAVNLVKDIHFTTNLLVFDKKIGRDYAPLDSFVVYMCVDGEVLISAPECEEQDIRISKGESVLIPACLDDITLTPVVPTKLLETYIGE